MISMVSCWPVTRKIECCPRACEETQGGHSREECGESVEFMDTVCRHVFL